MPASGVVPELDPGEYGQPCFSFVFPETPVDQFTFQRSKKTLSHCVIIGIATLPMDGWTHAHFPALFAEFNAGVLTTPLAVVNHFSWFDLIGTPAARHQLCSIALYFFSFKQNILCPFKGGNSNENLLLQYRSKEFSRLYNHELLHRQIIGEIKSKIELWECAFKVESMSAGGQWWKHNINSIIDA